MDRFACRFVVGLALASAPGVSFAYSYDSGHIGIYADAAGTTACAQVPPGTYTTLYVIASIGADFRGEIMGAEFRIEVTHPEGWRISYLPPPGTILIGNPIDMLPKERHDSAGANLSFTGCQHPDSNAHVPMGTLLVRNDGGAPTELLVKRRSKPLNRGYPCALFVDCAEPEFMSTCNTRSIAASCSQLLVPQDPNGGGECDTPFFVAALNRDIDSRWTAPPERPPVDRQVLAMLTSRTLIELPEGEAGAPLDSARIRTVGLHDVLHRHHVEKVAKGMPCFDLADTLAVTAFGDTVRLSDWSLLWVFTLPAGGLVQPLIDDLERLPEVVFAEANGYAGPADADFVRFHAPNPIVQGGTLGIQLSQPMRVEIGIYDVRGRRVRTIVDASLAAGPNDFAWEGRDDAGRQLPSGVYFAHVVAGSHRSTHKLVLLR